MVLRTTLDVADEFQDQLLAVPDRVTADANGGIVFEKIDGHQVEVVHVWGDGAVEYMKFTGTQLILRQPISGR